MTYYFMMDDKANKRFNFYVEYGRVDFEIQKKPYEEAWSRPITDMFDPTSPEVIYYNFVDKKAYLDKIDLSYDYYWYSHGFIISAKLFELLNKFNIQGHVTKKLTFTVNGSVMDTPEFYLLAFNTIHSPNFVREDFIDYERTEQLPSKTIYVVSRKIVLKDDIPYAVFQPSRIELLAAAGMVVTEEVKTAIEANDCGKGIRFLPIEIAQEEYCKYSFKDFNDLIKRKKSRIPGPKPS